MLCPGENQRCHGQGCELTVPAITSVRSSYVRITNILSYSASTTVTHPPRLGTNPAERLLSWILSLILCADFWPIVRGSTRDTDVRFTHVLICWIRRILPPRFYAHRIWTSTFHPYLARITVPNRLRSWEKSGDCYSPGEPVDDGHAM